MGSYTVISFDEAKERLLDDDLIFQVHDHCYNDSKALYSIRVVVKEINDAEGNMLPPGDWRIGYFQGGEAIELLQAMIELETERNY